MRWVLVAMLAGGCVSAEKAGPEELKLDRDTCTACGMVISDRQWAAEVRGGPRAELKKFDDVGCAVKWLEQQSWRSDPEVKVWVAHGSDGAWLNASSAHFQGGKLTPMGYGFGAVDGTAEGIDFHALRQRLAETGPRH